MKAMIPNWDDDDIMPISGISHFLYCSRQFALIHVEGVFAESSLTVAGSLGHATVDVEQSRLNHGTREETSLPVFSDALGISGIADVVEFEDGRPPFPVDYKHGRISIWRNQEAQVCAIGMCLEWMFGVGVDRGAIYHIQSRKRHEFQLDQSLRRLTESSIEQMRHLVRTQTVPVTPYSKACRRCSLLKRCFPFSPDLPAGS